jgi:hypothetical protein
MPPIVRANRKTPAHTVCDDSGTVHAVTFGGSQAVRQGTGADCDISYDGWYAGGFTAGVATTIAITAGASAGAQGGRAGARFIVDSAGEAIDTSGAATARATRVPFRSDTTHIFRNSGGHFAADTAKNRAIMSEAVQPGNLFETRTLPGGKVLKNTARCSPTEHKFGWNVRRRNNQWRPESNSEIGG